MIPSRAPAPGAGDGAVAVVRVRPGDEAPAEVGAGPVAPAGQRIAGELLIRHRGGRSRCTGGSPVVRNPGPGRDRPAPGENGDAALLDQRQQIAVHASSLPLDAVGANPERPGRVNCPGHARPADHRRLPAPGRAGLRRPHRGGRRARPARAEPRRRPTAMIWPRVPGGGGRARRAGRRRRRARRHRQPELGAAARDVLRGHGVTAGSACRSTSGCSAAEIATSSSTAARPVLLVDPEHATSSLGRSPRPHRFVLGADYDASCCCLRRRAAAVVGAGRGRHRDDQLHLRHHRAAQGRADHPPQHLGQRRDVRPAHAA